MSDLLFQQFSSVGSNKQIPPNTIASAATITLTGFLTLITGTVQIANIIPPTSGWCMVLLVFTNAAPGVMLTTGNIAVAVEPTQNTPTLMVYNPVTKKWYGGALNLT